MERTWLMVSVGMVKILNFFSICIIFRYYCCILSAVVDITCLVYSGFWSPRFLVLCNEQFWTWNYHKMNFEKSDEIEWMIVRYNFYGNAEISLWSLIYVWFILTCTYIIAYYVLCIMPSFEHYGKGRPWLVIYCYDFNPNGIYSIPFSLI